jgi:hypothetical protein
VVVAVGVITGLCNVEVEPSDPVHDHAVVEGFELAIKPTVPPLHIGLVLPGPEDAGIMLTVTVVAYTVDGLQPEALLLLRVSE